MINVRVKNETLIFLHLMLNDFKSRFSGSVLGVIWGFINPAITIAIYWFVFQIGLRSGARPDGTSYVLWLMCGIIPWFFLSDAVGAATGAFHEYGYLVKKTSFHRGMLPFLKMGSSLIVHLVFLVVLGIVVLLYRIPPKIINLQIIYYLLCNIALASSLGLFTSVLNVFLRDVGNIVGILIQIGFWFTPIVWGPDRMDTPLLRILSLNPAYYIVEGYRDSLLTGVAFFEKPWLTVYFWVFTGIIASLAYYCYHRLKSNFADFL